jgi:hypothetical protein
VLANKLAPGVVNHYVARTAISSQQTDVDADPDRLDYLAGIGVSVLWLMPFQPSPDRDDGYDVTDFYGVDARFERQECFDVFGPDEDMQAYGRGLRRRLPTMLSDDRGRMEMAYSLLLSLPGTPVLFYGEEIGMGENLSVHGRSAVRTPMQWSPAHGAGFSTADPSRFAAPLVEGAYGPEKVNVADASVLAVHNFSPEPCSVRLKLDSDDGGGDGDRDVVALDDLVDAQSHPVDGPEVELDLDRYGFGWFRLVREGQRVVP